MLFTLLLTAAAPASAAPADDRRTIVSVIEQFFAGLGAKDTQAILATVVMEGSVTSHVPDGGKIVVRTQRWQDWVKGFVARPGKAEEKMYSPDIRVRGTMAAVWTYYDFRIDGRFSHCGIDQFDMAKVEGRWRIVNVSFTRETQGCRRR